MTDLHKRFPVYSRIIGLYPETYRRKYETELLQTTADMLDGVPNMAARLVIWFRIATDVPFSLSTQHLQHAGNIMTYEMPSYLKRNSLIAGVLLMPFFVALLSNSLDKVINNRTLFGSWLWKYPAIGVWILYLPGAALLLALGSYSFYISRSNSKNLSRLKRAMDIKHLWPIVIPAVFAFGILFVLAFHDSVQCWVQPPSHLVSHISQAWQCSVNNQSLRGVRHFL